MQVTSVTKKYLITKSNDGCVVAFESEDKTHKTDFFIGQATMQKNIDSKTFIRHTTLTYNNKPIYIYHEDI
jgi:hypothetical protein